MIEVLLTESMNGWDAVVVIAVLAFAAFALWVITR